MPTLKKKWDKILQISFGLAAILAISVAALGLLVVVAIAVVLTKLSVFIE